MGTVHAAVMAVAESVVEAADRWWEAYDLWMVALAEHERVAAWADQRVVAASGGLGLAAWERACRRRRILTVADAKLRARAVRAREAVDTARRQRAELLVAAEAEVATTRRRLAAESRRMASYRSLAVALTGVAEGELRRLGRMR